MDTPLPKSGRRCSGPANSVDNWGTLNSNSASCWVCGNGDWCRGELLLAADMAADGLALAERLGDPGMLMEALFMQGTTQFYRGRFAEARACYETAIGTYDDRERTKFWTAYSGHNAGVTNRNYLALALWHLGYPDQALEMDRQARELARTIGHAFSLGHALDFTGFLCNYCRLGSEVEQAADEELAHRDRAKFSVVAQLGKIHKGAGMLLQGRCADALPTLLTGYRDFRATGAEVRTPTYLAILGEAYTRSARFEDARKVLDEGLTVAAKNDDRCHQAELYRLQGELVLLQSPEQVDAAEQCFDQAIATARGQQSRAWELRATISLCRLWQRLGRNREAQDALSAVYGTYAEGFKTPDLREASALLGTMC